MKTLNDAHLLKIKILLYKTKFKSAIRNIYTKYVKKIESF